VSMVGVAHLFIYLCMDSWINFNHFFLNKPLEFVPPLFACCYEVCFKYDFACCKCEFVLFVLNICDGQVAFRLKNIFMMVLEELG
jgi:hypothetical protein